MVASILFLEGLLFERPTQLDPGQQITVLDLMDVHGLSINGWEWHKWSLNASPAERARVRGIQCIHMKYSGSEVNSMPQWSNSKGLSARTNRVKLRNLLAAAEGAELLKATQLKVILT